MTRELALFVADVLRAERRRRGTRRALTPFRQAVLVLRWFRDATPRTCTRSCSNAVPPATPT
ncbi:hypothetical protein OG943_44650 [Amycolatopsis sp. NBC_00345]|uniref:hypothetical protein n=1 Tax=Amycolatopsis sp. NBC_00345 TaxID=2975955 RepID=UPI002E252FCD